MLSCHVSLICLAAPVYELELVKTLGYKDRIPRCYGVAIELSMGFPWYGIAMFLSAPMSMSNGRFVDNFC